MSVRQNLRILYIEDDEHLCSLFKERNQQYKDAMDDVSDIIEIGMPFEHFLRTRAERSTRKDGLKRDESYI